jgi:hypothetical protein
MIIINLVDIHLYEQYIIGLSSLLLTSNLLTFHYSMYYSLYILLPTPRWWKVVLIAYLYPWLWIF